MFRTLARKFLALRLREKLLLAALGPIVPALAAGVIGVFALLGTVRAHGEAYRISQRLERTRTIDSFVIDAESYFRGYANTGSVNFLQAYLVAVVEVPALLAEVEAEMHREPEQQRRLEEVGRTFLRWSSEVAAPAIQSRKDREQSAAESDGPIEAGILAAVDPQVHEQSRILIEEIRGRVLEFERVEAERIRLSVERSKQARTTALAGSAAGLALAVGLGFWTAWIISRRTGRELSELVRVAGAIAAGDVTLRAREKGSIEIVEVGRSFNRMADRIARRRSERAQLQELTQLLQASSAPEEAAGIAERFGPAILPVGRGALYLIEESRVAAHRLFAFGSGDLEADFASADCWAIRRAYRHVVRAVHEPRCAHTTDDVAFSICLPLATQGETFGVFHYEVAAGEAAGLDLDEALATVETFASELSLAFATLRLVDRLRQQSIRDPLTGLYNRRYFDETLERELARARRTQKPVTLVMVDLDHFKRFNDTFGHEAGDLVLREVGSMMRQLFRNIDVPCRLGGEELAVILPDAEPDQVRSRVEEMAMRLRNRDLKLRKQSLGRVTLSAGIAAFPEDGMSSADLLRAADEALYGAKSAGRDRLQLAS